jgi:hypothetical protein
MISIGGIVFGIGYAVNNRRLKDFGFDEIFQSVLNGMILGVLILAFGQNGLIANSINGIVSGANVSATCQNSMSYDYAACFAYNYLVGTSPISIQGHKYSSLMTDATVLLTPTVLAYAGVAAIGGLNINMLVASVNMNYILSPIISELGFIIRLLVTAIAGIYVQASLLSVATAIAIPLLIPVGIVLRTFYPTRKLGGALMAIGIGLFAVFPLTYLLDAQITASFSYHIANQSSTAPFVLDAEGISGSLISSGNSSTVHSGLISTITSYASSILNSFYHWVGGLVDSVSLLIIQVFFLPILSIILTVISIRELASALGSEISLGKFDIF